MEQRKQENVIAGIVGAFLGSLIGVVCTVVIGQLGYVASVSGLVMAVCALKGYEMLGGTLSKKGAVISGLLILVMTYLAHQMDWAVSAASALEMGVLECFRAIPYFREIGVIDSGSYWGGLVMLYLFTLLGAVPTIGNGLKNAGMPEMPPVSAVSGEAWSGTEERAEFYPPEKSWVRPLRIGARLIMLPGFLLGLLLLGIALSKGASIPYAMAALAAILSCFLMMFPALSQIQLNQAETFLLVRTRGMLWRVNLAQLNTMDACRFTHKNGMLRPLGWGRLTEEERELAKTCALRAISLVSGGDVLLGGTLRMAVVPLTDLQVQKENRWSWRITYALGNGREKKLAIAKVYPDLALERGEEPPQGPAPCRWGACALSLGLAVAFALLGGLGGHALEQYLLGMDASSSGGGKSTMPQELTARIPDSAAAYEINGVAFQVDGDFQLTAAGHFYDEADHTQYTISVRWGADENEATDVLLQPISDYRMYDSFQDFQFAHAGASTTLVPLRTADDDAYRYELLTLHFTDGAARHTAVALSDSGVLVTVEARQESGADEAYVRSSILYILESIQATGDTAMGVEITEENYQSLFHLAQEMGYEQVGEGYIKAPCEMFGRDAFAGVYVPYSETPEFLEDGYALRAAAHGMEVSVTFAATEGDARTVVDQAYEALAASGVELYQEGVGETQYAEEYDIAYKQAAYFESGTAPRVAVLYADCKQEGYYLSAQITYQLDRQDGDYEALVEELSDAFGLTLPVYEGYTV